MTDTDTTPADNPYPLAQNINIAQVVTAAGVIAAAFGLKLSPALQGAAVTVIAAGGALVTAWLHYRNHAVNARRFDTAFAAGKAAAVMQNGRQP